MYLDGDGEPFFNISNLGWDNMYQIAKLGPLNWGFIDYENHFIITNSFYFRSLKWMFSLAILIPTWQNYPQWEDPWQRVLVKLCTGDWTHQCPQGCFLISQLQVLNLVCQLPLPKRTNLQLSLSALTQRRPKKFIYENQICT